MIHRSELEKLKTRRVAAPKPATYRGVTRVIPTPSGFRKRYFHGRKEHGQFVDGHVDYLKIYWNTNRVQAGGKSYRLMATDFDPPANYGYKWKAD